jgi:hypothetical protein
MDPTAPGGDVEMDEENDNRPVLAVSSPVFSRSSSPLSDAESAEDESGETQDEEMDEAEEHDADEKDQVADAVQITRESSREKSVKREMIDQAASTRSALVPPIVEKPIPADVDLPALLATTIVFSNSSKLSLPDLVKHMLDVSFLARRMWLELTCSHTPRCARWLEMASGRNGCKESWRTTPCLAKSNDMGKTRRDTHCCRITSTTRPTIRILPEQNNWAHWSGR